MFAAVAPFVVATVAGLVVLWPSHHHQSVPLQYTTYGEGKTVFEKGTVTAVTSTSCGDTGSTGGASVSGGGAGNNGASSVCTTAKVALSNGPDKGHVVSIDTGGVGDVKLRVNDHIRVLRGPIINPQTGERAYTFDDYIRDSPLIVLSVIFAVLLVLVARWRGVLALVGLAIAYLVLAYFMLPALLDGRSPVAIAIVGSSAILLVVLYVAHGFSSRTTTALLGTLMALGVTAAFAAVATSATRLTGRSNEVNSELQAAGVPISISGLILCGLIIGALGVINDITVTQASSVWELSAADPSAGWRSLFTRGMRIGRDHIASVVYTIVFAYTGAALPLLILFSISGRTFHDILTGDEIAGEIVRDLVAGTGLVLAVPFTTAIAALIAARPHEAEPRDALFAEHGADDEAAGSHDHDHDHGHDHDHDPGLDALDARIATSTLRAKPSPRPSPDPPPAAAARPRPSPFPRAPRDGPKAGP